MSEVGVGTRFMFTLAPRLIVPQDAGAQASVKP